MGLSNTFELKNDGVRLKPIVAVGSLTLDIISQIDQFPGKSVDNKENGNNEERPGGGGFNFFNALIKLSKKYDANIAPKLVTKFGEATLSDGTEIGELRRISDEGAHNTAKRMLNEIYHIEIIDSMKGRPHKFPKNVVIEHSRGRKIYTSFSEAVGQFSPEFKQDLEDSIKNATLVFIHTRYPFQSHMAMQAAKKHGVPVFMDYSVTEPPTDDVRAETYEYLLSNADYIVAPAEAVTPKMLGAENAQALMQSILEYGGKNVAVSNNSDPVLVYSNETYNSVKVISVPRAYLNGIGDTRNGGTALALHAGADFLQAVRAGSAIASLKATTPGLNFIETMKPEDVPEMYKAVRPKNNIQNGDALNYDMDDV